MGTILKQISNNPIIVLTGWLGTMIALIIAIILPIIQKKRKRINYQYSTNVLITDKLSEVNDLQVTFKNEPIESLSVTSINLANNGNVTIENNDIYKGHNLTIIPKDVNTTILFAKVISQSSDTVECDIHYTNENATISFQTFEKGDYTNINIYHTGNDDSEFEVKGKIKEGKITSTKPKERTLATMSFVLSMSAALLTLFNSNSYHFVNFLYGFLFPATPTIALIFAGAIMIRNARKNRRDRKE